MAAFFDIDETLIRGASTYHLARALFKRGFFTRRDLVFAAWQAGLYVTFGESQMRTAMVRDRASRVMAGHSVDEVVRIGEEVYAQVLGHRIYPGTKKMLDEHLAAGHDVWLISATPTEVAELIARRIGATGALGTEMRKDNGKFSGQLESGLMHGAGKRTAIERLAEQRGYDLDQCYGYSDSINDLPLLETVGHANAINPEPRLRLWAVANNWPIHDFRQRRRRDLGRDAKFSAAMATGAFVLLRLVRYGMQRLRRG